MYMHFLQKNIDLFNLKKSKESEQNNGWVGGRNSSCIDCLQKYKSWILKCCQWIRFTFFVKAVTNGGHLGFFGSYLTLLS